MSSAEMEVVTKPVANEGPVEHVIQHDSHDEEYESADDAYEEGEDEEVEEIEIEEEVEEEEEEGDDEERSGSKLEKDKELDDDEDRKNPQFIPKKGYFYEHDDRTKTDEEGEETEPKKEEVKKVVVSTEPNRWSHDLFDQDQQAPKSKEELSQAYGYDIWSEENAPRARRRRRYGRGPNKYTRQWEDEEAYQKPRGGFRGGRGGRGGRGNYRDSARRGGDEGYEEDFPELAPGSKPQTQSKTDLTERRDSGPDNLENEQKHQRERNEPRQQQHRDGHDRRDNRREGPPQQNRRDLNEARPQQNRERREDYSRRSDGFGENERYGGGGPRGGRGGGGRGRGRRNEFSNRNRYPSRREDEEIGNKVSGGMAGPHEVREVRERVSDNRPPRTQPIAERKDREMRIPNPTTNGHGRDTRDPRDSRPKESPLPSKPPFTNTEYTGSASLTANRNMNRNQNQYQPNQQGPLANNSNNKQHFEDKNEGNNKASRVGGGGVAQAQQGQGNGYPEKPRDLRDVLNARRDARIQQNNTNTNDRRSQIPPRLQQHQQSQHQSQQHQNPHPQHQQQQQADQVSAKPKRFSTQRQRQVEQSIVNPSGVITSSVGGIPSSVSHTQHTQQGIPTNMLPVVTGTEQMVPSPVPQPYPQQAPTYYDGSQVYETSGSPVTVVTVANGGPSVSPSLWTPHVYANAPYPSPPTGPQVPQPAYTDHPGYIAAQPTGPIYTGPPPFIQDPGMMNYPPTAPPFGPPYHPQGFQGYPQVAPAPPPEVYHAGVTYYSPQTQIQRQPMMAPQKRPKSVLQLVEPPGKGNTNKDRQGPKEIIQHEPQHHHHIEEDHHEENDPSVSGGSRTSPVTNVANLNVVEQELAEKLERVNLEQPTSEPATEIQKRKPSPLPPQESWSAQMEEINSPTEAPEVSFTKKESEPGLAEEPPRAISPLVELRRTPTPTPVPAPQTIDTKAEQDLKINDTNLKSLVIDESEVKKQEESQVSSEEKSSKQDSEDVTSEEKKVDDK